MLPLKHVSVLLYDRDQQHSEGTLEFRYFINDNCIETGCSSVFVENFLKK